VTIEHQGPTASPTFECSDHVASPILDLLKHGSHSQLFHQGLEQSSNLSLLTSWRGDVADGARHIHQLVPVNLLQHFFGYRIHAACASLWVFFRWQYRRWRRYGTIVLCPGALD
jgi:hypothetical protein